HDHVPAPDRRDHRALLDPGRRKETPDRFRHDPGVHDLPLHDGIGGDFGRGHLDQLRLAAGMVDHGDLDDPRADVQAHRGFFTAFRIAHLEYSIVAPPVKLLTVSANCTVSCAIKAPQKWAGLPPPPEVFTDPFTIVMP